jgi:hypothetical protein
MADNLLIFLDISRSFASLWPILLSIHNQGKVAGALAGHRDLRSHQQPRQRRGEAIRTASAKDCHGLRGVSGARQRSGGVEK